jgi:hypothetical protein
VPEQTRDEDERQCQPQLAQARRRVLQVDGIEGRDEQDDADGDGRHRHQLGDGATHDPSLLAILVVVAPSSSRLVAISSMSGVFSSPRSSTS